MMNVMVVMNVMVMMMNVMVVMIIAVIIEFSSLNVYIMSKVCH